MTPDEYVHDLEIRTKEINHLKARLAQARDRRREVVQAADGTVPRALMARALGVSTAFIALIVRGDRR